MPNLTPTAGWDDIPELETTTRALGGPGGPINAPAQSLFNRTELLRTRQEIPDYATLRTFTLDVPLVYVTGYLGTTAPSGIAGTFILDSSDNTTADNGATVIVDASLRRWKRQYSGPVDVNWYNPLVTVTSGIEDWTAALQAALTNHLSLTLPYRPLGYRITSPVNLQSGQRITGTGGLVQRDDQNNHLFSIVNQTNIVIDGVSFTHNYFMAGNRGTCSAIYSSGSSQIKVTNCEFNNVGLFAVSTDLSGDGWVVHNNRFYNIAGTAYDARGGKGHIVSDNYILNTGDDAIDVANAPGAGSSRTVICNNIIINPGQIQVGGGGIRTNSAGATISGNQIENANMYFIVVAALSTDGTIRPDRVVISDNVGYGIKPTTNNTTGCVMVKNSGSVKMHDNNFDPVGAGVITVTNVVNNGSGFCRYTAANHGYTTGNVVRVGGVVGVALANGSNPVTVIDANTFDIPTFAFTTGTDLYVSGGTAWNATVGIRAYSGDDTPTQNSVVDAHDNTFLNVESPYRIMLLGLNKLFFNNNTIDTYYDPSQFANTSTMTLLQCNRNRWFNCNSTTGGIFDGSGAGLVTITRLELNDNEYYPVTANLATVPINFNLATVTWAEALRNKLNGAGNRITAPTNIQQFIFGNNVPSFFFDGDFSGTRWNQGNGTIAAGQTASAALSHACALVDGQAQQPKSLELQVSSQLGSTTPVFVQIEEQFSTSFVVMTNTAAPTGGVAFSWRMSPVVQRYVNGALSA